jgi:hypothetical protein
MLLPCVRNGNRGQEFEVGWVAAITSPRIFARLKRGLNRPVPCGDVVAEAENAKLTSHFEHAED